MKGPEINSAFKELEAMWDCMLVMADKYLAAK